MKIRLIILILSLFVLLSFTVSADNLTLSYIWLKDKPITSPFDLGLTALAFHGKDQVTFDKKITELSSLKSPTESCWPASKCTTEDTALAIMALNLQGQDITNSINWLLSQQHSQLSGDWVLELITQSSGECKISYKKQNTLQLTEFTVKVDQGYVTSAKCKTPTTEFNLGQCLESDLLKSNPSLPVTVTCTNLGSPGIVINYKEQNTYYLTDALSQDTTKTYTINNGNYGDEFSTLFTNLALVDSNRQDLTTLVWMKKTLNQQAQNLALMYLITKDINYANQLVKLQDPQGSFNSNIFNTALAIKALRASQQFDQEIEQARSWIESKRLNDGSWNTNIRDTAMVLYGVYSEAAIGDLGTQTQDSQCPELIDCDIWSDCSSGLQTRTCKNADTCNYTQSRVCPDDQETTETLCVKNGRCESDLGETVDNCPLDCQEELTDDEPDDELPPEEDEESSGFMLWFILFIFIGLIIFIAYYFMNKSKTTTFKPSSKKQPESFNLFSTPQRQPLPEAQFKTQTKESSSKLELDLEKSLREAKKLLGK